MKNTHLPRGKNKHQLEYPFHALIQAGFPYLTPNHARWLAHLTYARLTIKTLALSQVSIFLALRTATAPNTWHQHLKRLRQLP